MNIYMYGRLSIIRYLLITILCFNCAGKKTIEFSPDLPEDIPAEIILDPPQEVIESIPDWYLDIPVKEGYRYKTATAVSVETDIAINNAEYYASHYLADELQSEIEMELNSALVEVGKSKNSFIGKALKRAGKKIILRHVDNYTIIEQDIKKENTDIGYIYRSYILIEWDAGPAQEELLAKIKEHKKVYTMMASTELLEKLEGSVIAYINRDQEKQNVSEKSIPVEEKELILPSAEKIQTISSEKDEVICDGSCLKTPWWKFWITKVPCTCK